LFGGLIFRVFKLSESGFIGFKDEQDLQFLIAYSLQGPSPPQSPERDSEDFVPCKAYVNPARCSLLLHHHIKTISYLIDTPRGALQNKEFKNF
jgi:hypothetical protein